MEAQTAGWELWEAFLHIILFIDTAPESDEQLGPLVSDLSIHWTHETTSPDSHKSEDPL